MPSGDGGERRFELNTIEEFIDFAKKNPNKLNLGNAWGEQRSPFWS